MNSNRQRDSVNKAPGPPGKRASAELKGDVSAWRSMLAAASEEVGDDTAFEFQVPLPAGRTYDDLAKAILTRGAEAPGLKVIVQEVAAEFQLTEKESLSAIDRTLGGMFRAMTGKTEARPSDTGDPVAAAAFDLCQHEPQSMEALWPGWQEWIDEAANSHDAQKEG